MSPEGWHPKGWKKIGPSVPKKHRARMFSLCEVIKTWSACPKGRQHACVLTEKGKYIVSTGYNGVPAGKLCKILTTCDGMYREDMYKSCKAIHAEINALNNLVYGVPEKCIAFVSKRPCAACMKALKDAGVHEVYWLEYAKNIPGHIIDQGSKELAHYDPKTGR